MRYLMIFVMSMLMSSVALAAYVQTPYPVSKGGTGVSSVTSSMACVIDSSGHFTSDANVSSTELGYLNGVTSSIQTQINGMAANPMSALGDTMYGGALGVVTKLVGNTTTTKEFLSQTGNGEASAAPSWSAVSKSDVGLSSVTNDAQVKAISGPTSGNFVSWGADGATVADSTYSSSSFATASHNHDSAYYPLKPVVVDGGNAAYAILGTDRYVRSTTTLTVDRAYTLPLCTTNVGELHTIKNVAGQTKNIVLTGNTSNTIDGAATYTLLPGDAVDVICAVSGAWDVK